MDTSSAQLILIFISLAVLYLSGICIYMSSKLKEFRELKDEIMDFDNHMSTNYDELKQKLDEKENNYNELEQIVNQIVKEGDQKNKGFDIDFDNFWKNYKLPKNSSSELQNLDRKSIKYWRHFIPDYIQDPNSLIGASCTFKDNKNFNYFIVSRLITNKIFFGFFNPLHLLDESLPKIILPLNSSFPFLVDNNNFYLEIGSYDEITVVCYSLNTDESEKCRDALNTLVQNIVDDWKEWQEKHLNF